MVSVGSPDATATVCHCQFFGFLLGKSRSNCELSYGKHLDGNIGGVQQSQQGGRKTRGSMKDKTRRGHLTLVRQWPVTDRIHHRQGAGTLVDHWLHPGRTYRLLQRQRGPSSHWLESISNRPDNSNHFGWLVVLLFLPSSETC